MIRPGCFLLLSLAALMGVQVVRAQEVAYVTDILRLGIHRAQDTSDEPFRNLVSGTELTVLERVSNYARVRTREGEEGWVRSAFLVTEKPAQLMVAELTAELEDLRSQLATREEARLATETSAARMTEELTRKLSEVDAAQQEFERLKRENAAFETQLEDYRGALPIPWVIGALIAAFVGGLLAGTWWLDRSIRRRFGGHRIY